MLITDYQDIIKNIRYRKDRYLKDVALKMNNQYTDISLFECFAYQIWPTGLEMEKVINEPGNNAKMFNIIGLYDVKLGDQLIGDHINGKIITQNAIIAKIKDNFIVEDVTVIRNDQKEHIKLTHRNLGQNLLNVLRPKDDDVFERATLLYNILQNNDLDIYNDIIHLNIKNMIKYTILKDITSLYYKTLDTKIHYYQTSPTVLYNDDGFNINMNKNFVTDTISSNKTAKNLLYKIAKRLEKDDKMQLGPYMQKYKNVHKAFLKREEIATQNKQQENAQTLKR